MIHVCFGLHDKTGHYSKFTGTTMLSIFANTSSEVTVHILHDDTLTNDNREKFSYIAGRYNQAVKFYNVAELCPNELTFLKENLTDKVNSRFSIGAFYRLLIKKIFAPHVDKVIYLDSDIIVNLDIDELWSKKLKNFPIAAVPEVQATFDRMLPNKFLIVNNFVKPENYFCSGVIVINLDALNENFFYDGVKFLAEHPACESVDQDILNAFFSTNYLKLDQKFDSFTVCETYEKNSVTKKIYHYAGKNFTLDPSNHFSELWLEYFAKTPWFTAKTLGKIYEPMKNIIIEKKILAIKISAALSGKKRAFVSFAQDVAEMREAFSIRDDEEFILIDHFAEIDQLIDAMKKIRDGKVFFIAVLNFDPLLEALTQEGFVHNKDFFDALKLLTEFRDSKFEDDKFVYAM